MVKITESDMFAPRLERWLTGNKHFWFLQGTWVLTPSVTPVPQDPSPSSDLRGDQTTCVVHMLQEEKPLMCTKISKSKTR